MRHADPKRSVVVGGPIALRNWNGREIAVVERAPLDARGIDDLDAPVGMLDLVGPAHGNAAILTDIN